jgi:hypothetical protein
MKRVRHIRADKMRKKECFTSLQPCGRQSEQNDTDEPPSLFAPFFKTNFSTVPVSRDLPMFSLSKKSITERINSLSFPAYRIAGEPSADADNYFETEGFIIRDKRGRIKTIIFKLKRSM